MEIWCGESHGAISVFTMRDGVVTSQEVINHNDPVVENVEVFQVISDSESGHVWTFVYPGCHIFQWSGGGERTIKNRLDCSKLVPSSESLKTIAIDEHFSPGRCQVRIRRELIFSLATRGLPRRRSMDWKLVVLNVRKFEEPVNCSQSRELKEPDNNKLVHPSG